MLESKKLSLEELKAKKVNAQVVQNINAIVGGKEEYCHNGYGKDTGSTIMNFQNLLHDIIRR